jgi:hypothetical protein
MAKLGLAWDVVKVGAETEAQKLAGASSSSGAAPRKRAANARA